MAAMSGSCRIAIFGYKHTLWKEKDILTMIHVIIKKNVILYHQCTTVVRLYHSYNCKAWCNFQLAFLHAHLVPHPFWLLQLHLISSLQALDATGKMVHTGSHDWLSLSKVHPQPSGVDFCSLCSLVHHIPAWYTTPFECCSNASWVGGSLSINFPFLQKSLICIF